MTRTIYVALHGQDDNVGDSVLRRAMLEAVRDDDQPVNVLIAANSAGYVSALGLREGDRTYSSRGAWTLDLLRDAITRRAHYVSNAGEVQLNGRRAKITAADIVAMALVRLRGGGAVISGIGIRTTRGPGSALLRLWARLANVVAVRDGTSRDILRAGDVFPDWAVALHGTDSHDRDVIVCSFRGDREPPEPELLRNIRLAAEREGLGLVVVSQVTRDVDLNLRLAEELGAEHLPAGGVSDHANCEDVVREVYRRATYVVSDRLHVLLIAATEGAVPVSFVADPKIPRTFQGAGLTFLSLGDSVWPPRSVSQERLQRELGTARHRLSELTGRLRAALS